MDDVSDAELRRLVRQALDEDIGAGDATTLAVIPGEAVSEAVLVAREPLVVAGMRLAELAFEELASKAQAERLVQDGQKAEKSMALMRVNGLSRAILSSERVALNFLQRLSGIATLTARFVEAVSGTGAKILDTRKTLPGWRRLEKYAVRCGGGQNHRFGLHDMVLIKDNHLAVLAGAKPNPVSVAIQRARTRYPRLKVEVEADTLEQVQQAVAAGADIILLDNMPLERLRESVALVGGRAKTEASGGISLANLRAVAETGVDYISVGALTHSAPAVDIGLDFGG